MSVAIVEEIAGAMFNTIQAGVDARGRRVIVTSGAGQTRPLAAVSAELAYELDGVGALRAIEGEPPACVEDRPPGAPLVELAPMAEAQAARVLVAIARIAEAAHARGVVLYGIHPRLAFVHGDRVARAPRAVRFLLGMRVMRGGLCLNELYLPVEVWRGGHVGPAADVFALCALGCFAVTGVHPFAGDTFNDAVAAVVGGAPPAIASPLGRVLERGLASDAAARPSARQLRTAIEAIAA